MGLLHETHMQHLHDRSAAVVRDLARKHSFRTKASSNVLLYESRHDELTASPKSTLSKALCLIGGGVMAWSAELEQNKSSEIERNGCRCAFWIKLERCCIQQRAGGEERSVGKQLDSSQR
jgi:hypothetical protein